MTGADGVSPSLPDPASLEDVRWIRAAAKIGDAEAQYRLGTLYRLGRLVGRNYGEAAKWLRKAAKLGNARAQRALGDLCRDGLGVPEDWTEAASWYRKAAEQGDAGAQAFVGLLCHHGQGVTQDYVEAAKWHRKAADQGNTCAQYTLGDMHLRGQGVPQDLGEAARWFRSAGRQGSVEAQRALGDLCRDGRGVAQDHVEAATWYRRAAEQGDAHSQVALGLFYKLGLGVPCDYAEAATWYQKAAEQGDADAQVNLGLLYHHGLGVTQDFAEAATWYWKAADQGDAGAQRALGSLYRDGKGVPQDHAEAAGWFRKAAARGDAQAQLSLGHLYENGQGVAQDHLEAARWYRKATESLGPLATEAIENLKANTPPLELALLELEELPGLVRAKETVRQLTACVKVEQMRRERGFKVKPLSHHCVFAGPPGPGTLAVAALLGRFFKGMGILGTGTLVEVDCADLVAEGEGQTSPKVQEAVERALGGVLFIHEADALTPPGRDDPSGREAISALVDCMKDRRHDLVVVVAGHEHRMEAFLDSHPGLRPSFRWRVRFQDHQPTDLPDLFVRLAHADGLEVAPECLDRVKAICEDGCACLGPELAGESLVRQLFEETRLKQAARLAALHDVSDEVLRTLRIEDLPMA